MLTKLTRSKLWLCAVPGFFVGAALVAQTPGGAPGGGGQQPSVPQQQQTPTTAGPAPTAVPSQSYGDQAFLSKAFEGNDAEVQLGQLAQEKSQSNDVKQYAQKMVSDHTQMTDKWLKPVAKQLNVSEPKGPSKKDKKLIEKLQGLSGSQFDTEYIQAMVKDHKADLKEFQQEAQAAQDPSLKQIAQQGSNIISQQLQLIEQIAQAHNVPVEGKEVSSTK